MLFKTFLKVFKTNSCQLYLIHSPYRSKQTTICILCVYYPFFMQFDTLQLVADTNARSSKPISDIEFQSVSNRKKSSKKEDEIKNVLEKRQKITLMSGPNKNTLENDVILRRTTHVTCIKFVTITE